MFQVTQVPQREGAEIGKRLPLEAHDLRRSRAAGTKVLKLFEVVCRGHVMFLAHVTGVRP